MKLQCLAIILCLFWTSSAEAGLRFCNRADKDIQIAIMYSKGNDVWATKGWLTYEPGECANAISGDLRNRYYYYYAKRTDGSTWDGTGKPGASSGCVSSDVFEIEGDKDCEKKGVDGRSVLFRMIDTGDKKNWTRSLTHSKETISFKDADNIRKACEVLHENLERLKLRSQRIKIGHYTDILTPPQLKWECTNVRETVLPDLSTCTTTYDDCASQWRGPLGSWGCIPGTTTRCSPVKVCDTYKRYKKTMECDITFQLKLPGYIEKPIAEFIDNSFDVIESARQRVEAALPIACAPDAVREAASRDPGEALAAAIGRAVERRIRDRVEREAREWLQETAFQTIAAAIPSGGIGGGAVMSTKLANFVYRVHRAVRPILNAAKDVADFAEDVGFSTSCGWNEWHEW